MKLKALIMDNIMARRKVVIYGCAIALTGFIASITMSSVYPCSSTMAIGGFIAQSGGFIMFFIVLYLYKVERIGRK